ncbi:hypothetical protein F5X96DRAFT_684471 [Biscogniauxia mediterranea]|nr:hypothetical protein F5X96DRAFT_684471 [Biscogniauxia mediterranea]
MLWKKPPREKVWSTGHGDDLTSVGTGTSREERTRQEILVEPHCTRVNLYAITVSAAKEKPSAKNSGDRGALPVLIMRCSNGEKHTFLRATQRGPVRWVTLNSSVGSVTVDRETNQLASTVLVKYKPGGAVMGLEPTGEWGGVLGKTLSSFWLKQIHRTYIDCINAQTLDAEYLAKFCHLRVIYNAKPFSVREYGLLIQEAFTALPDIVFEIHSVVADERAHNVWQRESSSEGRRLAPWRARKPTVAVFEFCEHVTYQLTDGKDSQSLEHH